MSLSLTRKRLIFRVSLDANICTLENFFETSSGLSPNLWAVGYFLQLLKPCLHDKEHWVACTVVCKKFQACGSGVFGSAGLGPLPVFFKCIMKTWLSHKKETKPICFFSCATIIFENKIKTCENTEENTKTRPVQTTSSLTEFQNVCQRFFGVGLFQIQSRLQLQVVHTMTWWSRLREPGNLVSRFKLAVLKLYVLERTASILDSNLSPWVIPVFLCKEPSNPHINSNTEKGSSRSITCVCVAYGR